jgi:hypothetical protein
MKRQVDEVFEKLLVPAGVSTFKELLATLGVKEARFFYQVGAKKEGVSKDKRVLVEMSDGQLIVDNAEARVAAAIGNKTKLSQSDFPANVSVFVESTSANRKIAGHVYLASGREAADRISKSSGSVKKRKQEPASVWARCKDHLQSWTCDEEGSEKFVAKQKRRVLDSLNPGATAADLAAAEKRFKAKLPADVVKVFSEHNGQKQIAGVQPDEFGVVYGVIVARLLPLSEWKLLSESNPSISAKFTDSWLKLLGSARDSLVVVSENFVNGGVGVSLLDLKTGRVHHGQAFSEAESRYMETFESFQAFFDEEVLNSDVLFLYEENFCQSEDEDDDDDE